MLVTDWADVGLVGPIPWLSVVSEWGIGMPMVFVGLNLMWTPEGLLNWLTKYVPWWHPEAKSIRLYGCFVSLLGVLSVMVGVSRILSALRIFVF